MVPPTAWTRWRGRIVTAVVAVTLLVLTPFLLVSETTIKGYVEGWLKDCVFVVEWNRVKENRLEVKGYISGAPPKSLPITFSGKDALINRIQFVNEVERDKSGTYENLGLHPQTDRACPGKLCEILDKMSSSPKVSIELADLKADFVYPFYVDFDTPVHERNLRVFVQFDEGLPNGICRVERASLFNKFVRMTKLGKFITLIFLFVLVSVAIAGLREMIKGGANG